MDTDFNFAEESKQLSELQSGQNWTSCNIGNFEGIKNYVMENKEINLKCLSKLFLHKVLGLTGTEVSFNTVPAGTKPIVKHRHRENEELIIVLSGEGILYVDDNTINVKEGSVIRIAPDGIRTISTPETSSLTYICIQTKSKSLKHYTLTDAEML